MSAIQTVEQGWQGRELARLSRFFPSSSFPQASSLSGRGPVSCMVSLGQLKEWGRVGLKAVKPLTHGIPERLIVT